MSEAVSNVAAAVEEATARTQNIAQNTEEIAEAFKNVANTSAQQSQSAQDLNEQTSVFVLQS